MDARILAAVVACCAATAVPAGAQIPPAFELRVPKPPTVAVSSAGGFLAYELHMTNLTPNNMRALRLEVMDGAAHGRVLATVADSALQRDLGRPGPITAAADRPLVTGGMRAIAYLWFPIDPRAPPASVRHRVTLQQDSISHVLQTDPVPVQRIGATIGPPLRGGDWLAANGPSNASGHRRLVLGLNGNLASAQRFAIDFVQLGETATFNGDRTNNAHYHAYGEDVLAVADGIVVETKDGIPENVPGPTSRAVKIDLHTVSGNSIVIDIGAGRFAFYAHLIPGSLRVRKGERVSRGQVIGRVGNSGNSTEPHLHFHLVDGLASGTSTLGAEGIPYALEQFEVLGRCTGFVASMCTRDAPITVRGGIPTQNQIIRFPN
jgi:hypothetical protein